MLGAMQIKKHSLLRVIKLALLSLALWWVFTNIDASKVDALMKQSNPWMLLGAVISFWLAQAMSGLRMRYYFSQAGIALGRKFSVAIYLVASFYNFLLPGGIGGDAYKVYVISRMKLIPLPKGVRIALSERASGLFILCVILLLLVFYTKSYLLIPYGYWLSLLAVCLLPIGYFVSAKLLLHERPKTALGAMVYSLCVQGLNIVCVLFLLDGLSVWQLGIEQVLAYILLFLLASVASVLPLTIGGVGLRELVFLYGASFLDTDAETGVALALMFFLVSIVVSMHGAVLQHRLAMYEEQAEEEISPPLERGV